MGKINDLDIDLQEAKQKENDSETQRKIDTGEIIEPVHDCHLSYEDSCDCQKCRFCGGSGVITRTEWTGTDTSYEKSEPCVCQED